MVQPGPRQVQATLRAHHCANGGADAASGLIGGPGLREERSLTTR